MDNVERLRVCLDGQKIGTMALYKSPGRLGPASRGSHAFAGAYKSAGYITDDPFVNCRQFGERSIRIFAGVSFSGKHAGTGPGHAR